VGHLLLELADVIGLSETGLAPDLLAESIGETVLKLADAGCQAGGALVGGKQVGLQGGPGDGRPGYRPGGWQGLAGMDPGEQVAVPVEERAVHPGPAGDRRHADLFAGPRGLFQRLEDALTPTLGVSAPPGGHRRDPGACSPVRRTRVHAGRSWPTALR
jgi:hypothetical protein